MISGKILRDAIISGANNINNQRSRVDELNVFPVPDGDTGTNMGMTVGASVRELEALDDSCTVAEAANDIPMIQAAGLGLAFCAKPKTQLAADKAINDRDLTHVLDYLRR